jgi:bifunctional DNA-binding transcriptional regulator/antitoxin component of YhaV-PrlF toxin-antitoxin module
MSEEVKRTRRRRPGITRLSRKHQATIPVAVLAEAGIQAGEPLRVEALGPGRIILTRAEDSLEDLLGALDRDVYPEGYLQELRAEWD